MRKRGLAVEQGHHDGAGGGGGNGPTLDEVAENPGLVAGMSAEEATGLLTRCAVVLLTIIEKRGIRDRPRTESVAAAG